MYERTTPLISIDGNENATATSAPNISMADTNITL